MACHARGFEEELTSLGYGKRRADSHLDLLADLSGWLEGEGLLAGDLTEPRVAQFLGVRRSRGERDLVTSRGVALLLGYLRDLGVVPPASPPLPDGPAAELLGRYRKYLTSERGLAERAVRRYLSEVGPFVASVTGPDGVDWAAVSAANVTRFLVEVCGSGRVPSSNLLAALRSFLRFAHLEGWIMLPLMQAVPSVAGWNGRSLPRRLEPNEVRRLLGGCDRHSAAGRRDYAMLTLLVRMGLRAAEVAGMCLEDIDWRAGELVVRGKGRRDQAKRRQGE